MSLWIGGEWLKTKEQQPVTHKYTGEVIGYLSLATRQHVSAAVEAAKRAMKERPLGPQQRYEILFKTAALIEKNKQELALLIAQEGGKPYKEAIVEVMRSNQTFTIAAEEAKRIHGEIVPISTEDAKGKLAFTVRRPVGVICAIAPFNFPINLVAHKIAPAIAAGCAFVLKPSSYTPLTSVRLCELLAEAGLPRGYGNLLTGGGQTVGEWLLAEEGFGFYTFTGSPAVGKRLKEKIGLRRCTLELGSNSATIVHSDADISRAALRCARTAFSNAGQICISVQRIFVQEAIYEDFLERLADETKQLKTGDPTDPQTDVGPMIQLKEAERAEIWVQEAVAAGAALRLGGKRDGSVMEPTILTGVDEQQKVCCEEAFAPVVVVNAYRDFDEAIAKVNQSKYGLQGGLFTSSLDVMMQGAREIEVGGLMVNETSVYRSDEMPYGGVKESGIGREGPKYAVEEMTETKLVVIH